MVKRVVVTLHVKDNKPEEMTVVQEGLHSSVEMLIMLNEAIGQVLSQAVSDMVKKQRIVRPDMGIVIP